MEGLKASEEEMERRDRWRAAAYDLERPAIYAANLLKRRAKGPLPKRCHERSGQSSAVILGPWPSDINFSRIIFSAAMDETVDHHPS